VTAAPTHDNEIAIASRNYWGRGMSIIGAIISVSLFVWCIHVAFEADVFTPLAELDAAGVSAIVGLLALTAASITLNGLVFWIQAMPLQHLPLRDVLASNAIAITLGLLPFKMGAVVRALIHVRRNKMSPIDVGLWFGGVIVVLLIIIGSVVIATLLRPRLDALWYPIFLVTTIAATLIVTQVSRYIATRRESIPNHAKSPSRFPRVQRLVGRAMDFSTLLQDRRIVFASVAIRITDTATQALRFWLVASLLQIDLSGVKCVILSAAYFLIGSASPSGSLGAREAGTTGLAIAMQDSDTIAGATLMISGLEAVTALAMSAVALAYLTSFCFKSPTVRVSAVPNNDPQ